MHAYKNYTLFVFLFWLHLSHVNAQKALKNNKTDIISLPYKFTEVVIEDHRRDKQPMGWKLPAIAVKKIEKTGNPEISPEDIRIIKEVIKKSESANGDSAKITVKLLEGRCNLYVDWKEAKEFANVVIEIEIVNFDTINRRAAQAEGSFEQGTLNALERTTVKLYRSALKECTYLGLKQFL